MKQVNSSIQLTMGESMLQTGHVVKDKWQVVSKIGQGAFGEVYKCKDFTSNRQVALKLVSKEGVTSASHLLKLEVTVLKELQGKHHFPKFIGFGKTERFDYLVMELLGPSLSELKKHQPDRKFSLSTTLRLGRMMLKCIHSVHKMGYLHRDIKPSNFTIGIDKDNRRRVYLLDFGLARQYILDNGEVRPPRYKVSFHGTPRYASLRVLQGKEAGRQDDLISLFYTLSEFSFQDLPWKNIRDYREMAKAKEVFDHQLLVKEFPGEFQDFYNHISGLTFFDKPDYDMLDSVFDRCIKRRGVKETDPFDFEENGNRPIKSHLKKDSTLTVSTKSSSDVLIIDCVSFEESENRRKENQIKRSKSTSNNMHHLVPTSGLGEIKKESLLRSKSSDKVINKKNINSFLNNCKDTGFTISPLSTNSHYQPSVSISIEPECPQHTLITSTNGETKTKLKSQSFAGSNKCLSQHTENLFMNSLLKDNNSYETNKRENIQIRPLNTFLKKNASLCTSSSISTLSLLRCCKDKKKEVRHSVRRSVSHPASTPSHLLIKSIFYDFNKEQEQQGLPRCWSCPTISLFIRSDLKPPLKQQASFDENVYEVDVMRNVAAKQLVDDRVHVDCRRNSLPCIHSSKTLEKESSMSSEENRELIRNNISDSGISSLSVMRRAEVLESEIPNANQRGVSNEYDKNSITPDSKVQKSLSDSSVYQRSASNNFRLRCDPQMKKSAAFKGITLRTNALEKTKISSITDLTRENNSNKIKNTFNSIFPSKSKRNDEQLFNASNGKSFKYITAEQNDEITKEQSLVFKKDEIAGFELQHVISGDRNSEVNHSGIKDNKTINDSKTMKTISNNLGKGFDSLEKSVSLNIKNVLTADATDASAALERDTVKSVDVRESPETKANALLVHVTESDNDNMQSLGIDTQRQSTNYSSIGDEILNEVVSQRDNIDKSLNRRQRANAENKYVKDESELKLHFIRRRQRPSSAIYETKEHSDCFEEHESCKFPLFAPVLSFDLNAMTGNFQNKVDSKLFEQLQTPSDDPPGDYCLPSRRRRYKRAITTLSSRS